MKSIELSKEALAMLGIEDLEELTTLLWKERRRRYGIM